MRLFQQIALLCSLAVACRAQETTLHTTTTLVVVPTLVQTSSQNIDYNLTASDFILTDNGIPQKITLEPASTQPLSLVLLMQTGGSAIRQFPNYRNLKTMIESMLESGPASEHAPNQVAIVNFDSQLEGVSPFTSSLAEWTKAINHPEPGDRGAAILDGVSYALSLLKDQPATNRRAILLISQPTDDGSKTSLEEILRTTAETNTTIYALTFSPEKTAFKDAFKNGSGHANPPLVIGAVNPGNANPANPGYSAYFDLGAPLKLALGAMRKNFAAEIASLSGGENATFNNQHELDESLSTLATHMRNRYVLTFQPATNQPGLHTLEVRLPHHPELSVSARAKYWTDDQVKLKPASQ
jgi:VWFA-related protein